MQYNPEDRKEFEIQIKELLEMKLIVRSKSPHSSPAFLVENEAEKRRGKKRMVINYKALNKETIDDGYFLPKKEELLTLIRGKMYYFGLDCKSGFWQVRLDEESQLLTAFSYPQGQYHWKVVSFGLKQAQGIFQRHMDNIFKQYLAFCCVYVDDILVFSNTEQEHYKHLEIVLKECKNKGIVLSEKKANLCQTKLNYLGQEIKEGKHRLQPHVLNNVQNFPSIITDKTQLQRFLSCLTYEKPLYLN